MNSFEKVFHKVLEETQNAFKGKMFGAECIKSKNGKVATFFWKENMVFKLDEISQKEALKLKGSKIGTHIYDSKKEMKGWVLIPGQHSDKWEEFTKKALKFVDKI